MEKQRRRLAEIGSMSPEQRESAILERLADLSSYLEDISDNQRKLVEGQKERMPKEEIEKIVHQTLKDTFGIDSSTDLGSTTLRDAMQFAIGMRSGSLKMISHSILAFVGLLVVYVASKLGFSK